MIVNNSTINNTNSINDTSKSLTKKKSSNKINAVISKYLEIKQDADEFLEKLNKKKNETKNKFNKYNILIKKRQTSKLLNDINNNSSYVNMKNNYQNLINNSAINNTSQKINNMNYSSNIVNNTTVNQNLNMDSKNEEFKKSSLLLEEIKQQNLNLQKE